MTRPEALTNLPTASTPKLAAGSVAASWPDLCVIIVAVIALLLKVVIAFNTFGTNDAVEFYRFAAELKHDGLQQTYRQQPSFNHPPLVASFRGSPER